MTGRGRGRGRRNQRNLHQQVASLARRLAQVQVQRTFNYPRGRFDPPRVVTNPRWPLVLDTTVIQNEAGTQTINNNAIRTAVKGQLGLPANFELFNLYYLRVDLWTTPTDAVSSAATLAMRIVDFDTAAYSQWLEDQGTVARPGHVHAVWPRSQQIEPRSQSAIAVMQVDSPAQFTGTLHVHLMMSFSGGDVLPTLRRRIDSTFVPHPEQL